jgi:hypothetical protein
MVRETASTTNLELFGIAPVSALVFALVMLWFTRPRDSQGLHPGK